MDFTREEMLDELARSVARFVEAEVLPVIERHEREGRFPHAIIERMGEMGFFGAAFGEEVGGTGAGFAAVATIAEEISRLRPEFGYAMNMQAMTCPFTIYNWGSDEQVMRFVPDLIAGRRIGMFALSEAGGGSDAAGSMRTTAVRDGGRYLLNGSKMWITFADVCDTGLLFAKTDTAAGHRGITAFIVEPKRFPGFRAEPIPMRGLSKCLRTSAVFLDDFEVPVENRLGEEGEGFKIAMSALDYGRLTVSARLTGLAQACFERAVAYARERVVGGSPIGRYQLIQQQIADMAVEIDAARLLTSRTAWLMDQGRPSRRAAAYGKYFAGSVARRAAQAMTEIFGGYALADAYPVSYYNAYITTLCAGEGSPNVQRILIAEDALGYKDADRHPVKRRLRSS
ncbi:MAG TPA: acyl-CoA dehydrogenase family protein [Geminicoccaceae bacterium]